jgi:Animal haem peroxidase
MQTTPPSSFGSQRRRWLKGLACAPVWLGAGATVERAAAQDSAELAQTPSAGLNAQAGASDRFTRLFPQLPPFAPASPALTAALQDIGRAGGLMDAADPLSAGPVLLITDLSLSANNRNAALPGGEAGTTFFGQFVDHDVTFDIGSRLGMATSPQRSTNARSPALDLDSMYGAGPVADPLLYETADRAKLRLESGGLFEDLPRLADGRAVIADPRNDEHVMLSGLHAAFMRFHNHVVDRVRAGGESDPGRLFAQARRTVTWHYHWLVLHELLPSFIGRALVNDILRHGRQFDRRGDDKPGPMPVEFQGAAYRFGHSMVRPSYRANLKGDRGQPFFAFIFDPAAQGQADPSDLRGGARAPRRFVGWQTFFDFGDGQIKPRKRIDTRISTPLFRLPLGAIASGDAPSSLAQRNLLRHLTWQLPSGQRIAQAMGLPSLRPGDLSELAVYSLNLERSTPLWYYLLKEAQLATDGQTLGPVGGRIVGEVLIGLMQNDPESWLRHEPRWRPTLPSRDGAGEFRMVDLLTLAGVDPASRGQ